MIDINFKDYYCNNENIGRAKKRLIELSDLWVEEVWYWEFWIKAVFSWLYIDRVWWYTDKQWDDEILWIKWRIWENK